MEYERTWAMHGPGVVSEDISASCVCSHDKAAKLFVRTHKRSDEAVCVVFLKFEGDNFVLRDELIEDCELDLFWKT